MLKYNAELPIFPTPLPLALIILPPVMLPVPADKLPPVTVPVALNIPLTVAPLLITQMLLVLL